MEYFIFEQSITLYLLISNKKTNSFTFQLDLF